MPEIVLSAARPREDLVAAICRRTSLLDASLSIIAEGLLGAGSPIDLVAVDGGGRLVLVLVGDEGRDLELFTRGIAQRAWVAPRVRDWLQLSPSLGLSPEAPVRVVLLSPSYHAETVAAAASVGPGSIELARYRWVENGSTGGVLIERLDAPTLSRTAVPTAPDPAPPVEATSPSGAGAAEDPASAGPAPVEAEADPTPAGARAAPRSRPGAASRFRTGLTEEDLRLTPQEARDFE